MRPGVLKGIGHGPVLVLDEARLSFEGTHLSPAPMSMRLDAGDCVLVTTRTHADAAAFADLCSGLLPLESGRVLFQELDWVRLPARELHALRGRIGRIFHRGAWNVVESVEQTVLMSELHHTRRSTSAVTDEAVQLAQQFGLPGLPVGRPNTVGDADLARASCVRAFLGSPALLLIEPPTLAGPEVMQPVMQALAEARGRGAAAICFSRRARIWEAALAGFSQRLALNDDGLVPHRSS